MNTLTKHFYQFGPFRIDAEKRVLMREGKTLPLKPKAFDTLLVLVRHHGEVLEKQDLMDSLWPDSDVEESNLPQHISALRKTLGESPNERRYIVTVPGRGYRFAAEVEEFDSEDAAEVEEFDSVRSDGVLEKYTRSTIVIREQESSLDAVVASLNWLRFFPGRRKPIFVGLSILVVALFLALALRPGLSRRSSQQGNLHIQSLAVIPFRLRSAGGDEYLAIGIADSLITRLSNLRDIKVRPTSSILRYNNQSKQPAEIGRELGVEAILEGTLYSDGESIRTTVQLVRVEDGTALWANTFRARLTGLFKLEDSISGQVAESLVPRLTGEQKEAVTKRYTENNEAYLQYVQGRYYWTRLTPDGMKASIDFLQQATDNDPDFALAFAALSNDYAALTINSDARPNEAFPKAKAAATRALEIDDQLSEAHAAIGNVSARFDWDWGNAEGHLKRAIALNPNNSLAHYFYAHLLCNLGRFEEAIVEERAALDLEPLSPLFNSILGEFFFEARRYDQAIVQLHKALELDPNFWIAHVVLGKAYVQKGMYSDAIVESQMALQLSGGNIAAHSLMGYTYAVSGNTKQAKKILVDLEELSKERYVPPCNIAMVYAGLGETSQSLEWLERAYNERDVYIVFLKVDSRWDRIRPHPRFASLLQRVGF